MSTPFDEEKKDLSADDEIEAEERKTEPEEEDFEEGSTVFSAPVEKKDKVRKPGLWKKALFGVGVLIALAGVIAAVVMLVAELTDDDKTATAVPEYFLLNRYMVENTVNYNGEDITTQSIDYEKIEKVSIVSDKLTLNIKAQREEGKNTVWLEETMPEEYTSTATVGALAKSAMGLKYTRIISEQIEADVDYGFNDPTYTILITPIEGAGEPFTVTVGKQSADKSGYYVTVSDDQKVYFITESYVSQLEVNDIMELSKAMRVPAFSGTEGSAEYYYSGSLVKFDHMYFKNNNLDHTFKFVPASGEAGYEYNTYRIVEPVERLANDTGITPIIELFSNGIDGQGLYSFTKTEEDLKRFGLDDPDLYVSVKAGEQERTIIAKLQKDGNYALVASDMEVILNVKAASLTPVTFKQKNLYSVFFFIENLRGIDEFVIESGVVRHTFGIDTAPSEDNPEQLDIVGIRINGAASSGPEEFQSYYQYLLGITAVSYASSDIEGKSPAAIITLKKVGDAPDVVIEYYEAQNGRYQVVVNGSQQGLIGSASFKNILKYAENVAAGKAYNS